MLKIENEALKSKDKNNLVTLEMYKKLMEEKPEKAVLLAVKGMLPKNSMGRNQLKRLRVFAGAEHPHTAQQPEALSFNKEN